MGRKGRERGGRRDGRKKKGKREGGRVPQRKLRGNKGGEGGRELEEASKEIRSPQTQSTKSEL
jgi:hypothetical protein